jgi:hypothetical protein
VSWRTEPRSVSCQATTVIVVIFPQLLHTVCSGIRVNEVVNGFLLSPPSSTTLLMTWYRFCNFLTNSTLYLHYLWPAQARDFPITPVSRPALRSTQPPVQWTPGVLSPGLTSGRGVTLTTHPHLVPSSWMIRSYTSSPLRLHKCVVGLLYSCIYLLTLCMKICGCCLAELLTKVADYPRCRTASQDLGGKTWMYWHIRCMFS